MMPEEIPLDKNCQIIAVEEPGVYIIDKSHGVLSHPNERQKKESYQKTLLKADYCMRREAYSWTSGETEKHFYLCHRLDSATSGIIIGCMDPLIAQFIKEAFSKRLIKKTYLAITHNNEKAKMGKWQDSLIEKRQDGKLRVAKGKGPLAITIASRERWVRGQFNLQLLKLKPLTGRTHQLRYQCMARRMPIIGDKTYGDFSLNRMFSRKNKINRLCLHASEIEFEGKYKEKTFKIFAESPFPRQLGKIFP
jgi:23S rRNA-/tRNA-specific pseudouridylate synthase